MIKYSFKILGLSLALLVSILSCSTKETSLNKKPKQNYFEKTNVEYKGKQYNTFHNGKEGYEILIPQNWLYKNNKNTALTMYTEKVNDIDFVESLDVISKPAAFKQQNEGLVKSNKVDLNSFYTSHLINLNKNNSLKVLSEGEEVINNNDAKWVLLKSSNAGEKLHLLKYFMASKERVYIITGTCKAFDYAVYGPQFNSIISSFKLL